MYTFRLIYYRLRGEYNLFSLRNVKDWDKTIRNSIMGLGIGGVIGGRILSWLMIVEPYIICIRRFIKRLVLIIRLLGGWVGYVLNNININSVPFRVKNYKRVRMRGSMWFLPLLRSLKIRELRLLKGGVISKAGDMGWMEYFGGQGVLYVRSKTFEILRKLQVNRLRVLMKIFMTIFIIILVLYRR